MRLIAKILVSLAVNAIALLVAAILLDGLTVDELSFPIVVVVYTAIELVARPAFETIIDESARWLASFVGLVAAFATLLVTDLASDGLDVHGAGTWIVAPLVVWGGGLLAGLLVADRITRKIAGDRADERP